MDANEMSIGLVEARNLLTARCDRRLAARAIAAVDAARNTHVPLKEKVEELECERGELLQTIAGMSRRLNHIDTVMAVAEDPEKLREGVRHCYENRDCDGCPYHAECRAAFNDPGGAERCPIEGELLDLIGNVNAKAPCDVTVNKNSSNPVVKMFGICPKCKQPIDNYFNSKCCGRCGQNLKWPAIIQIGVIRHDAD